jgi:uridylate kinase
VQIEADLLLKGTKVDGVYEEDPTANPGAKRLERLSYLDYLNRGLRVMDSTSISFCMDQQLPVIVFNIYEKGNLSRALLGEEVGSIVAQ